MPVGWTAKSVIIYLDGPTNVGKTTVGELLRSQLPDSIHIDADQLRQFARGLPLEAAIPFVLDDILLLAANWVGRGNHVIISWPISPDHYKAFAHSLSKLDQPLYAFTLLPSIDRLMQNRGNRELTEAERRRIKEMFATYYVAGRGVGETIDNSQRSPQQTANKILGRLDELTNR